MSDLEDGEELVLPISPDQRSEPRSRPSAIGAAVVGITAIGAVALVFASGGGSGSGTSATTSPLAAPVTSMTETEPPVTSAGSAGSTTTTAATVTEVADPASGLLFGDPADVVLVFDDGLEGVIAVDPDQRLVARSHLEGQRAGDQPYRLHGTGDSLVVGWSTIHAVDMASGDTTRLGDATMFIPAAETDAVWLVDYPGSSIGSGTPTVSLVETTGNVIIEPTSLDVTGFPAIGIPGGIAVETTDGVALWDAATDTVTERLGAGEGPGLVGDVAGNRLVWCTLDCQVLHVTDLHSRTDVPTRAGFFVARASRFSPDGQLLAVPTNEEIAIIDIGGERLTTVRSPGGDAVSVAWAPDGNQVIAASYGYGLSSMQLVRYVIDTGDIKTATLPFGGGIGFIVLNADQTDSPPAFRDDHQDPCPSPGTYNHSSAAICSRF